MLSFLNFLWLPSKLTSEYEGKNTRKETNIYIYIYMKKVNRYFKDIGLENILKKIMKKEKNT